MTLGMSYGTMIQLHMVFSLIGILVGIFVLLGMVANRFSAPWTAVFLASTLFASLTGFPIPPFGFDAARAVGILTVVLEAIAIAALYIFRLEGQWRWLFVASSVASLYFNCFVGVAQTFQKVAYVNAFAPTQTEAPFAVAQFVVLVIFIALGYLAARRFHPELRAA
jgi:hypothetical protein